MGSDIDPLLPPDDTWVLQEFDATGGPNATKHAGAEPAPAPHNRFVLKPGAEATIVLVWDDPWGTAPNDYDLFIREDGNIYKIQTNSTLAESDIIWGQAYGDARHTGRFGYQPPGQSALMIVAATFGILFICSFGAIVSTRKSRDRKIQRNQKP